MTASQLVRRRFGGASAAAADPETLTVRAVLLASENRQIPPAAVDLAARIAKRSDARVHVFSIARIWGTSLGFPNPGLFPNKQEWAEQRAMVEQAVARLEREGVEADARVIGTRAGAKRIVGEARARGCGAIVMGADPPRNRVLGNFVWAQEPYRVRRRADVPVFLVVDD